MTDKNLKNFSSDFLWFQLFFWAVFIVPGFAFLPAKWLTPLQLLPIGGFAILFIGLIIIILLTYRYQGHTIHYIVKESIKFENFGWIVLLTGELAIWMPILCKNVEETQKVWVAISKLYCEFVSSPDMFRVLIVGVVVLFIGKMYRTHERMVEDTDEICKQLEEVKKILPQKEEILSNLNNSQNLMTIGANFIQTGILLPGEPRDESITKVVNSDPELGKQMVTFSEELRNYIRNTTKELSRNKTDTLEHAFHLHTYLAMAEKYLELEKFIYKRPFPESTYAYEYRTWFAFYALVVKATVESLLEHKDKYKFYTILPKKPSQFFNISDSSTPLEWAKNFLEDFNRKCIRDKNINYYRYFLMTESEMDDPRKIIPNRALFSDELKRYKIFVEKDTNNKVVRAILVGNATEINEKDQRISEKCALDLWKNQCAKGTEGRDRYLIVKDSDINKAKEIDSNFDPDLYFADMYEAIIAYHNSEQHCFGRVLRRSEYRDLFAEQKDIPCDMFVIQKDNDWIYCIGALQESPESDTMKVRVYRPECKSWDSMKEVFNKLFLESHVALKEV